MSSIARGCLVAKQDDHYFVLSSEAYTLATGMFIGVPVIGCEPEKVLLHQVDVSEYLDRSCIDVSKVDTLSADRVDLVCEVRSGVLLAVQSRVFSLFGYADYRESE
jgi:hypothetical protein